MKFTEPNLLNTSGGSKAFALNRRDLIKFGAAGALAITALGCKKYVISDAAQTENNPGNRIDFAAPNDIGLLNYLYALEQLEAAFYLKVCESFPADFTDLQKTYFNELKLHEQTHVAYFASIIGNQAAIGQLDFDLSSVNFSSKISVLATAQSFEDLGVAAYNGALEKTNLVSSIITFSQIATVEARHAGWVRNQVVTRSSVSLDQLTSLGANATQATDVSLPPAMVLQQVMKYIKTKLEILNA
ncbi:ferritin-like domain-containing protein [Pedobacter sp. MC2016-05]|uniref:ferritin-like domain-containing protein n=1 Tax=Pedobacter sp. MC2016-05 TaxID=2994474 RepID=UPI00224780C6|nr:ferritin-like domain-containing protein [Pedobacter sp. MC2016-05]MCX2477008.1 ferritin-like domain-containing protein [Pedobacter sp. MC2016-05]